MSKCISSRGEYSEHEPDAEFCCQWCFGFDEGGALKRIAELEAAEAKLAAVREYIVAVQNSPGLGQTGHHDRWLREALEVLDGDEAGRG